MKKGLQGKLELAKTEVVLYLLRDRVLSWARTESIAEEAGLGTNGCGIRQNHKDGRREKLPH